MALGPRWTERRHWLKVLALCRRLGLGLIAVRLGREEPRVTVACDPGPYRPRRAARRREMLLGEFQRRSADHNPGGGTRRPVVTAYREDALRLARELKRRGPLKVRELREATGCAKAGAILGDNFYGWFERIARGVYGLTARGEQALETYGDVVRSLG